MNRTSIGLVRAGLAIALLSSALAIAHDFWLQPSSFRPEKGVEVHLALRVGENFRGEPAVRKNARIERFEVLHGATATTIVGEEGAEPAGSYRFVEAGLHTIVFVSNPARIELQAEEFNDYLRHEGLDAAVQDRTTRGESDKPGSERYARSCKSLVCVGAGAGSGADRAVGLPLELIAKSNPYELAAGSEIAFRLLHKGRPLPDALVAGVHADSPVDGPRARTDAEGRVRLKLNKPGPWLIKTVHMERAEPGADVDWSSTWATLTFEMPAKPE